MATWTNPFIQKEEVTYEVRPNGHSYFIYSGMEVDLDRLCKLPNTIITEDTRINVISIVAKLMIAGIGYRGIDLYITGKLDRIYQVRNYCKQAMIPYKLLADIIKPI